MEQHEEHTEHNQNTYVDLVLESHDTNTQQIIFKVEQTQSQKKRRRFIPFKYHSKIFKASKKKPHVEDHRISTNSSSYASCKTFKKDSSKSNVSSNTYQEIEFLHHAEPARCNSIASKSTISDEIEKTPVTDGQGMKKASLTDSANNRNTQIRYQMEIPKKTGRNAKKYIGIFCMVLICAILSAAMASVFSTKSLRENIKEGLSNVEFQTGSNASIQKMESHIRGVKSDMKILSNKIHMEILLQNVPNRAEMEKLSDQTEEQLELFLQTLPNKTVIEEMSNLTDNIELLLQALTNRTDIEELKQKTKENIKWLRQILPNRSDMEELSEKTEKNIRLLLQILPNRADPDVMKEENEGHSRRIIHAIKCITDCSKQIDGDYQSCFTCNGYISCSGGYLSKRPCADQKLYWDDFKKQCLYETLTCDPLYTFSQN